MSTTSAAELRLLNKRKASRLFTLKNKAEDNKIGRKDEKALEQFCIATYGVPVEVYVTDEFAAKLQDQTQKATEATDLNALMEDITITSCDMTETKGIALPDPNKTGTAFDFLASRRGGPIPGTVNIITGESGAGKTTLFTQVVALILITNEAEVAAFKKDCKAKKIAPGAKLPKGMREVVEVTGGFLSAEMSFNDWVEECEKMPILRQLPVVYARQLSQYTGPQYLAALKKVLGTYDYLVVDSLAVIAGRIKDQTGMSEKEAMAWLLDTMNELAESKKCTYYVIQHYTKSGTYVGSTRLKHDTTSMSYVMLNGTRSCLVVHKNRRGDRKYNNLPLYFDLDTSGTIVFDEKALSNDLEELRLQDVRRETSLSTEDLMNKIKQMNADRVGEIEEAERLEEEKKSKKKSKTRAKVTAGDDDDDDDEE